MKKHLPALFLLFIFSVAMASPPMHELNSTIAYHIFGRLNNPGKITNIDNSVMIISKNEQFSAKNIADKIRSLSDDQICISLGASKNDPDWEIMENGKLYLSKVGQKYGAKVLCDIESEIIETIKAYDDPVMSLENVSACPINSAKYSTYCIAVLTNKTEYRAPPEHPPELTFALWVMMIAIATLLFALVFGFITSKLKLAGAMKVLLSVVAIAISAPLFAVIGYIITAMFALIFLSLGGIAYIYGLTIFGLAVTLASLYLIARQIRKNNSNEYTVPVIIFAGVLILFALILYGGSILSSWSF